MLLNPKNMQSNRNVLLKPRKIIHVDMDCFFAAIEMRDNPSLQNKPVAVGGTVSQRGVLSTCNYTARKFGLHSAMPTAQALKLCPKLVLLPVNMDKYKRVSKILYRIFKQYTPLVEMLSIDEAFLDVADCKYCQGSATWIAQTIKMRIKKELGLTASAGVAPNKFLAKVASAWNKPDGLFAINPNQVADFVKQLPVEKIFGVGKVTAKKLHAMNVITCLNLQQLPLPQLVAQFGKMGNRLYYLSRGIDERLVEPELIRKSLSVEKTFPKDLKTVDECLLSLTRLIHELKKRFSQISNLPITKQFIKIKFYDFKITTAEASCNSVDEQVFFDLFRERFAQQNRPVRLLGAGVRFKN
jgi:DNA polymerase-4